MAPRFKQNMYQTYAKDIGADALICFPFSNDEFIFPFRDKVSEKISKETNLYFLKYEGEPTEADSWLLFFNSEGDAVIREKIYSKHSWGFWDYIFKTKKYKEFKKEEQKIEQLVQAEIITSHDHTCIEIYSSIHSENSLTGLIEASAMELNIDILKNDKLPSMKDIICSNRTFNIKN